MNKIIILNGPPGSGKDSIAEELCSRYRFVRCEFKEQLHKIAMVLSGLGVAEYFELYNNRDVKEVETPLLLGFSPRSFLIHISEVLCKPYFGKEYFGTLAAGAIKKVLQQSNAVFSDGGFPDEINAVYRMYGKSIVIVRLSREGYTFEGDSRDYVLEQDLEKGCDIKSVELRVEGTVADTVTRLRALLDSKAVPLKIKYKK